MTGLVLSILIGPTVTGVAATLPALSVQSPSLETDVPVVSAVSVWLSPETSFVSTPDRPSAQVKLTVTLVLFQPKALAPGLAAPLITGAVLSMLIPEIVFERAALPALSVHDPVLVTDCPAPSTVRVAPATVSTSTV